MRIVSVGIAVMIAGVMAAGLALSSWNRGTASMVDRLARLAASHDDDGGTASLPAAVERYFRRTLVQPHLRIRSAIATQQAEFFINGGWRPLTATQYIRTGPPGFVWDARIQMAPFLPAFVRDAYVDGEGTMRAALFSVYPLVEQAGVPELNAGALQRFLGEAVWFPTALLPSSTVSWRAVDDLSALSRSPIAAPACRSCTGSTATATSCRSAWSGACSIGGRRN